MKAKILLLLLLLPMAAIAAQGYKIIHPDGTVEFTDQPAKNAEEIDLPAAQGYLSPGSSAAPSQGTSNPPTTDTKQQGNGDYTQFAITYPAAEETIPNSGGSVSVAVAIAPALQQGHQVVITLDGGEAARGTSVSFTLNGVERGAHLLGASIVDASGAVIRQASPVTFYIFQQSLLNPNRPR